MKKSHVLIAFFIIVTVYAGATIQYFHASSESDNIKLEWQSLDEFNLQKYVIERKTPQNSYIEIDEVAPKGDNSFYTYVDQNVYKTNDAVFIYRLKMVDFNGTVTYIDQTATVSHSVSGFKQTWGSIKAMFR